MAWIPDPDRVLVIVERLENNEYLLENAIELFLAFFTESNSPEEFPKRMAELKGIHERGRDTYKDPEIGQAMNLVMSDPDAGAQLVIDRLHGLGELFEFPYKPDEPEDVSILAAAIHYHATLLVRAMRQSGTGDQEFGYGDDVAPIQQELERLFLRCGDVDYETLGNMRSFSERMGWRVGWRQAVAPINGGASLHTIRSISERVGAELAFQRGEYAEALRRIEASLEALTEAVRVEKRQPFSFSSWEDPSKLPPWLTTSEDLAKSYLAHLRENRNQGVNWLSIMDTCRTLKRYFSYRGNDQDQYFWEEMIIGAQLQLTPDQLRSLYEDRIHQASVLRLSRYFFPNNLWEKLRQETCDLLVTADSTWMSDGSESRLRTILSPIQIASENILYYHLWIPLMEWSKDCQSDREELSGLLERAGRQYPGLTEFIKALSTKAAKSYFKDLGITDDDLRFLTSKIWARRHFQNLRNARNKAVHEPDSDTNLDEIRELFSESLGIGRRGVLPELVRILGSS